MAQKNLICIENCRIEDGKEIFVKNFSWTMKENEVWLAIGPNGGGKADFVNSLAKVGNFKILPNYDSDGKQNLYSNIFGDSAEIVSFERAAKLIQEERENDESEYIEGGVDIGRTGRVFIAEGALGKIKKGDELPAEFKNLESNEIIKLCGIEKILDRGIKYMSTGEIRRTLLARALFSGKKLLILSDPFAGLDAQSRKILFDFLNEIAQKNQQTWGENQNQNENEGKLNAGENRNQNRNESELNVSENQNRNCNESANENKIEIENAPHIILATERWSEIPSAVTNVIEFSQKNVTFCGKRSEYEKLLKNRELCNKKSEKQEKIAFSGAIAQTLEETKALRAQSQYDSREKIGGEQNVDESEEILVEMNNVNVAWGENHVIKNLSWKLKKNEHWLVRGPNGSGKTTFLELITGDNKQVFCNDVRLFGKKRGTGESIWDIKKRLGIVSYRLHVEYRMVGGATLQDVIASGFRDSIGLYGAATDVEIAAAKKWLSLGGFSGRENQTFASLSYGEQRAVLILRSAVKCPKILILDEPCHGLDEQYRKKILQLIEEIAAGGTTTLLHVTHDPTEVLPCEKRVLEFNPGENPMYKILLND